MDIIFFYTLYSIQAANFHDWPDLIMEIKHPDKALEFQSNDHLLEWFVKIVTPKPDYFSMN
jgi:hypothetical protein